MAERLRRLGRPVEANPGPTGPTCRPRYNQNLPSWSFPQHKSRLKFPTSLNSRQWIFVRKGLDDFRKGCPPCEGLITKGPQQGFLPLIDHRAPQPALKMKHIKPPKEAVMFPKLSPAQWAQKRHIEDIEARLARHPLAACPNLEESLPVELLLKVLEVLDPDRQLEDTWAYCQDPRKRMKEPAEPVSKPSTDVSLRPPPKTRVSHSHQWVCEEKKPQGTNLLHGPLLYDNIREGVDDFCSWVTAIGSSKIDEEFILRQFEIDCENKPTCDVLHTMRLNKVPQDRKSSVGPSKLREPDLPFRELDSKKRLQKPQNPYKREWVKMRYGAWYLNTKLWKKQRADEPLVDPKILQKTQDETFQKEPQEKEDLPEELLGTAAFKDFILRRGYRMPRQPTPNSRRHWGS
ncbi:protein FAM47E isoform X2 [Tenrec ecaudatus]|uniref:protein FAM47E isoform X2 n=1 Tax=Tenrec ecaudatus TaxID=94439 RepID=UPI003F59F0C9